MSLSYADNFVEGGKLENGAELVNLTPYEILIFDKHREVVRRIPSFDVARAESNMVSNGELVGIPIRKIEFSAPINLPDFELGKWLIVTRIRAEAAKAAGRNTSDLLLTADAIQDKKGRIVGCSAFLFFE